MNTPVKTETNFYDDYELGSETKTEHYLSPVPNNTSDFRSDQSQSNVFTGKPERLPQYSTTPKKLTPETAKSSCENYKQSQNKVAIVKYIDGSTQTSHQSIKPLNISSRVCDAEIPPATVSGTFNVRPNNSTNFVSTQNSYFYHEPIRQDQMFCKNSTSSDGGAKNSQKTANLSATSKVPDENPSQHDFSSSVTGMSIFLVPKIFKIQMEDQMYVCERILNALKNSFI